MVAISVSLVLLAGVLQIFTNSNQVYRVQDALSRVQENARFATEFLNRDIRQAGYAGCSKHTDSNQTQQEVTVIADADGNGVADLNDDAAFAFLNAFVQGFDNTLGPAWVNPTVVARVPGTDVIVIRQAASSGATLTGNMATTNANIQINNNFANFQAGDRLIITDCEKADVFVATNVANGAPVTIAHANTVNIGNNLSKLYKPPTEVVSFVDRTYFIGVNPAGNPALYQIPPPGGIAQEMVEGVANMQIQYGQDTNGSGSADIYLSAGAPTLNMTQVVSVRVSLLVQTLDNNVSQGAQTYNYNGAPVVAGDRRLRRVFTSTIALRNRNP